MKINLGSADNLLDRPWVNVDRHDFARGPAYDFRQVDLNRPWPFEASSVSELRAHDIFEHLWPTQSFRVDSQFSVGTFVSEIEQRRTDVPPKVWVMNEAHRVLRPGAVLSLIVPTTDGRGAFQDPTHVTWWTPNDMFYFCEHWPEWKRFKEAYGITAQFRVLTQFDNLDLPERRGKNVGARNRDEAWDAVMRGHTTVANLVTKLHVMLEAVK